MQDQRAYRLTSIDMLRGMVIVIMALDHIRDYFMRGAQQDPMQDPDVSVPLYFTRWITHFCAPVFVCLAGVSAGLMAARKTPSELARFLISRGLWLVFVEIVVVSTAISFAPLGHEEFGGRNFLLLQVIWAIGAGMVLLGLLQFLGRRACLLLGVLIVIGHNGLATVWPTPNDFPPFTAPLWIGLLSVFAQPVGPFFAINAYPVLPWLGILLVGFGSATLFERPADERRRALFLWGALLTAGFLIVRALDIYGDPNHWQAQAEPLRTLLDFLNTSKYPPSLLFTLMTLGPAAIFCAFADRWSGWIKDQLVMFGRVPFAFYIAHWFLIHGLCVLLGVLQGFPASAFLTAPVGQGYPAGYGLPLWGVYLVWTGVVAALYPFCRWMAAVKARSRAWWLSYL